jgi:hypothetical protein
MTHRVIINDRATGEHIDEVQVQALEHGATYKAMIAWRGITKIEFGDTMGAAVQNVFNKFNGLAVLSKYDIKLASGI